MGKTCLDKLTGNILVTCSIPVNGVKNIYIMHAEHVTFSAATSGIITSATFTATGKSYRVEGYKQNIQMTTSMRSLDASNKLDVSLSFKILNTRQPDWRTLLSGRFYALVVYNDNSAAPVLVGIPSPLEATASDFDSNAGAGLVTITLGPPEGSAGCYLTGALPVAVNTIISKSV